MPFFYIRHMFSFICLTLRVFLPRMVIYCSPKVNWRLIAVDQDNSNSYGNLKRVLESMLLR